MTKPPKIDRKSLKGPDSFVRRGREFLSYLAGHRSRFAPVLVVCVAVVIGAYGYDQWSKSHLEKGWTAFHEASKQDPPKRWEALKQVHASWGRTRPGYLAAVNLGDHFFDEGKKGALPPEPAKPDPKKPADAKKPGEPAAAVPDPSGGVDSARSAAEWYGKALDFSELLPAEKQLLTIDRGNALELQKKYEEALTEYQKAAEMGTESRPYALLQVARAQELKNEKGKAIETYEKISADYSATEYAKMAKNLLRRLKSPLFTGEKL